jgi:hypothetical protein
MSKYTDFYNSIVKELWDLDDQYLDLGNEVSILDGYFTSKDLRRIADAMDELREYRQDNDPD